MSALIAPALVLLALAVGVFVALRRVEFWRERAERNERHRDEEVALRKAARVEHSHRKVELQNARDRIASLELKLAKTATGLEALADEGCGKVRLHSREQAAEFIASLSKDTNQPADWFTAYPRKVCPRQPVGTSRFWHVGHIDRDERTSGRGTKRRAAYHKRGTTPGAQMSERFAADQIEALRARFTGGAAS